MDVKHVERLQEALIAFLGVNGERHYGEKSRLEQSVEDLAQALFARCEQLKRECRGEGAKEGQSERTKLADTLRSLGELAEAGVLEKVLTEENLKSVSSLGELTSALRKMDLSNYLRDSAESDFTVGKVRTFQEALEDKKR